jgi:hypothetical protein
LTSHIYTELEIALAIAGNQEATKSSSTGVLRCHVNLRHGPSLPMLVTRVRDQEATECETSGEPAAQKFVAML